MTIRASVILALVLTNVAFAEGLFTQMVLTFPEARPFKYRYEAHENTLVLELGKTRPHELKDLEYYDERVIRRLIMKDMGVEGTEVKLFLKTSSIRATVYHLEEPFRIAIDLFDNGYREGRDPITQLPLPAASSRLAEADGSSGNTGSSAAGNDRRRLVTDSSYTQVSDQDDEEGIQSPQSVPGSTSSGKRQLLQPVPELFMDPGQMNAAMRKAEPGIGKAWSQYPIYMYRLQTAAYEANEARGNREVKANSRTINDIEAMAEYAGNLYNFGHETRALIAYQQVLQKDPTIFNRNALHLWKFAEVHLGQGNIPLARGYYDALVQKHPESPLAKFAKLRKLDLASDKLIKSGAPAKLVELVPELAKIEVRTNGELRAQVAIRQSYWSQPGKPKDYSDQRIPDITDATYRSLANVYDSVEGKKTAFISANLMFNHILRPGQPWNGSIGDFADDYFTRYKGTATEPYRGFLKDKLQDKLNKTIQQLVADGKLIQAIRTYEALPRMLRSIRKTPETSWALAEAYRQMNQVEDAIEFYQAAAKSTNSEPDRFKSEFWLTVMAGNQEEQLKLTGGSQSKREQSRRTRQQADVKMAATWARLVQEQQQQLYTALKPQFEDTVNSPSFIKTPAKIILNEWTKKLGTNISATAGTDSGDWDKNFSPTSSSVFLISNLAKRFGQMGMNKERRQSLNLLRQMKPQDFVDDKKAKELWSDQLLDLAEEYRTSNEMLEAGKLYKLVGEESNDWEGRAETLYKAGLLLFRSGRRQEALDAFQKSAEDVNNLKYSELAKERLSQLQNQ